MGESVAVDDGENVSEGRGVFVGIIVGVDVAERVDVEETDVIGVSVKDEVAVL